MGFRDLGFRDLGFRGFGLRVLGAQGFLHIRAASNFPLHHLLVVSREERNISPHMVAI